MKNDCAYATIPMGSRKSRFIALADVVEGFGPAFAKISDDCVLNNAESWSP